MQFYIAIDGEKQGPHSLYIVTEMLREGQVKPDALGWHQGSEKWAPLRDYPAFQGIIKAMEKGATASKKKKAPPKTEPEELREPEPPPAPASDSPPAPPSETSKIKIVVARDVHPFIRFWARIFDYWLVFTVVLLIVGNPFPAEPPTLDQLWNSKPIFDEAKMAELTTVTIGAFAIWHGIEAILLYIFGATPGKALFRIRIRRHDGGRPPLAKTLGRAYFVWIAGFGLGLFPFNLIAMAFSFFRLLSTGSTLWDKHLRLYVQHAPIGPARILLAVTAFILLMALQQLVIS